MPFSDDLLTWYDAHCRQLPWRGERDPYRIWLSEIMLQQTQARTVARYYARFLERCPTVGDLADAPQDEVMKLWEGLGYYSRARNLHAAAQIVARELNGRFPGTAQGLRRLPGIGPYAANAIASIAYGERVPALDGNQARVLSRVLAWDVVLKTPFDLLEPALALMDAARPGDYNQALMDLGADVCTPRQPACDACPVSAHCRAFAADAALDYPKKPTPIFKREAALTIVVMRLGNALLVRRRPPGLLGGLYEFCPVEGHFGADALAARLAGMGFASPRILQRLPDSRHVFTHLVWRMQGWAAVCDAAPEGFVRATEAQLEALAFPSALRAYRQLAAQCLALPEA